MRPPPIPSPKSAGVTEPILYRHFGSKQELFIAITREVSDQTLKHWRDLIGPIDDPLNSFGKSPSSSPAISRKWEMRIA